MHEPQAWPHTLFNDQIHLAALLKAYRVQVGVTQKDVASTLEWSLSKVIRSEAGLTRPTVVDVKAMAELYRVPEPERTQLVELARRAKGRAWWREKTWSLSDDHSRVLGYECSAGGLVQHQVSRIPALLQSADYARAAEEWGEGVSADSGAAAEIRQRRQEILWRPEGRSLRFLIDETVLWRPVGGVDVLLAQLDRLLELARLPHVQILVVPMTSDAATIATGGNAFTVYKLRRGPLDAPQPPDVHSAHSRELSHLVRLDDDPEVVARAERFMAEVERAALGEAASVAAVRMVGDSVARGERFWSLAA